MLETPAALRIDVDSRRDVALLPQLLDLLQHFEIKASFFVTTGPDRLALNMFKYLTNPRSWGRFIKARPLRYRLQTFNGILQTKHVEAVCPEALLRASEEGHELGLHGYDHYTWMNTLQKMSEIEIAERLREGLKALQASTQAEIKSFASPGFRVTDALLQAIDKIGFDYSSDFKINQPTIPFYPERGKIRSRVLQVPVSMDSIGELFIKGLSRDQIKAQIDTTKDVWCARNVPLVLYAHPVHEIGCYAKLFSSVLQDLADDARFTFLTLAQIAQEWKVRV
jgi:undecaprenyl phosphate-alpha-L-ara4FN deformylase